MIALGNYILSIVGIVILGVIIDIMLVEGQMQKYIKSIFVIFVIFVIIAPIPNLMKTDFSVPKRLQLYQGKWGLPHGSLQHYRRTSVPSGADYRSPHK